jgi:hypothetical protein
MKKILMILLLLPTVALASSFQYVDSTGLDSILIAKGGGYEVFGNRLTCDGDGKVD